ncbi:hypothetical protein WJX74_000897 [Apatococcus lobatus]|uniref:RCC1-like domain-containing protein n=1 Tax=Apatococcus lobatus TaxID=904363 RepID=A0AAW1RBW3_9CHLO
MLGFVNYVISLRYVEAAISNSSLLVDCMRWSQGHRWSHHPAHPPPRQPCTELVEAAASAVCSLAVDKQGRVWAWGTSKRGQLGLGPDTTHTLAALPIPGLEGIAHVACGWGHAAAVTYDGELWTWGYPQHGRLGHSFATHPSQEAESEVMSRCVWAPRRVSALEGVSIKQVVCGADHTLAVTSDNQLLSFGDSSLQQLGRSAEELPGSLASTPEASSWLVNNADGSSLPICKVAAGLAHCLALTPDGLLYSWGWNAAGCLGLGEPGRHQHDVSRPTQVYGVPHNPNGVIAAGRAHSMLLSEDLLPDPVEEPPQVKGTSTQLFAWGSGAQGRLGSGTQIGCIQPELCDALEGQPMLHVACGYDHTLVLARAV